MANVIDSLLVTLGLDASAFKKGTTEAEKATESLDKKTTDSAKKTAQYEKKLTAEQTARAKFLNEQAKKTVDNYSKARNELLLFLSLFTAGKGLLDFASSTIKNVANLERLSEVTAVSVSQLGAWQLAAKNTGGSAEEMSGQILKASQDIAAFRNGIGSQGTTGFLALGGKASELTDTQTYLMGMSRVVSSLVSKYGEARAFQFANQRMGMSLNEFNLLKLGTAELSRQLAIDEKIVGLDNQKGQQAVEMQKRWNNLAQSFEQSGRTVLFALTPALEELGAQLQKVGQWGVDHKDDIKTWVVESVGAVKVFVHAADDVAQAMGGWKIVFEALIGLKIAGYFLRIASSVLMLGTALKGVGGTLAGVGAAFGKYSGLMKFLTNPLTVGSGILAYSPDLNKGEDAEVNAMVSRGASQSPRGIRNNNPGNIRYGKFAQSWGAVAQDDKGFAVFPDRLTGENAEIALLGTYLKNQHDTIRKIISRYAPASENDTGAYIKAVSQQTGIGADVKLSAANLSALSQAIFIHENGAKYAAAPSSTNSAETNIGQITINTQAKDASGIAFGLRDSLVSQNLAWQMNTGVR